MLYINGRFLTQKLTGVQRFAFEMVKGLLRVYTGKISVLIPPKEIDNSYTVVDWPIKTVGFNQSALWEQLDLPFFLNRNGSPLLVNLVNTAPAFYRNQIVSILDMTTFINPNWFSYSFAKYYKFIVPLIAKNCRKIITISGNSKTDIVKYIDIQPEKVEVIYCGVADQFKSIESILELHNNILPKLRLNTQGYVLAVSSLDPRKNFKRLIEAYNLSDLKIPLVIVGSEGKVFANDGLRKLLASNEKIVFTGYVSDSELIALYKSAKCFVYPSLYEGFGMPPLEAMASGCATIVSDTSSMPEVCGDASLYVDPLDVKSINTALIKLIDDEHLRLDLVKKGFERVKHYSWDKSADNLLKLINNYI